MDEGPLVGGPHAPYRQSQRRDIHVDVARRLLEAGHLYESYSTTDDTEARHRAAGRDVKLGYDNYDRVPDAALISAAIEAGRLPVLRLRMPDRDIGFADLVRGQVTFPAGSVPDPVMVRGNGDPLYTLVNPVDDALMGITHVLRGEDLLPSTPRQIALYEALVDIGVLPSTRQNSVICRSSPARATKSCPSGIPSPICSSIGTTGSSRKAWSTTWPCSAGRWPRTGTSSRPGTRGCLRRSPDLQQPGAIRPEKGRGHHSTHLRLLTPAGFAARLTDYVVASGRVSSLTAGQQPR